ncbi:cytochrome c maturation protein CcmE [Halorhodospira neutriphila]|uniref:Cytochrome c-type biogenesis protein CcmE n=1 Tax=Halorhodospira neutriphila TaxID=168379 RepID=A0ABS1E563_9GAMM|nr:cytochrome c maturation protein CcmE [Halorhodospira neutriphila]MBK1726267.1 cytochrome c biogenesis protein CcmE [Halorhodospira neutriphila]
MKQRHKRLTLVLGILAGASVATALVLNAFSENLTFFITPSEVQAKSELPDRHFRIGGIVKEGSIERQGESTQVVFKVTDLEADVPVRFDGVLPDLFQEGEGVVVEGHLGPGGVFEADNVMARHDADYMPEEAAEAIERAGGDPSQVGSY